MPFFTHPSYQYVAIFLILAKVFVIIKYFTSGLTNSTRKDQIPPPIITTEFKRFQRNYVVVSMLVNGADGLHGAYVYPLYITYGLTLPTIELLFLVAYVTSLVVGPLVGSLADRYGRKKMCILFAILYSLSCLTKHSSNLLILIVGRILAGISTSLLFSSFESYMVREHHDAGFREELLGSTFALCTTGNAVVAALAGVAASRVRKVGGPVGPFDASILPVTIAAIIVAFSWKENTGDGRVGVSRGIINAWSRIREDYKIALLGLSQACFEGGMHVFVLMWTPALETSTDKDIPTAWIFATFMLCVWMGTHIFQVLLDLGYRIEKTTLDVFVIACVSLVIAAYASSHWVHLFSFCIFQVCCGVFWPSMGCLRSRYVPEEVRATVMNFFRIPLNIIICLVLFSMGNFDEYTVFMSCCACLSVAVLAQLQLVSITAGASDETKKDGVDLELNSSASLQSSNN